MDERRSWVIYACQSLLIFLFSCTPPESPSTPGILALILQEGGNYNGYIVKGTRDGEKKYRIELSIQRIRKIENSSEETIYDESIQKSSFKNDWCNHQDIKFLNCKYQEFKTDKQTIRLKSDEDTKFFMQDSDFLRLERIRP